MGQQKELIKPLFVKQGRFSVSKGGYKIDRLLIGGWALFVIIYVLAAGAWLITNGGFYLRCPNETGRPCENPYFNNCDIIKKVTKEDFSFLCYEETLMPGVAYGVKPTWWLKDMPFLTFGLFILTLLANHVLHNKHIEVEI